MKNTTAPKWHDDEERGPAAPAIFFSLGLALVYVVAAAVLAAALRA